MAGFITVNKQQIPWSFVARVNKMLGGDWERTKDCFWKARDAQGDSGVMRYVMRGFVPDKVGVRYSLMPSKERETGHMAVVRAWWETVYIRKVSRSKKTSTQSVKDIFRALAQ